MADKFFTYIDQLAAITALDQIALAYLQDWHQQRPIDGGVAFEAQLRQLSLDGSMQSLSELDNFLLQLKPQFIADIAQIRQHSQQRNLLLFIAFYSGAVLTYQAHNFLTALQATQSDKLTTPTWISYQQLGEAFPPLMRLIDDDFSYSLALSFLAPASWPDKFIPTLVSDTVFFPLVTIIERLYPKRHILTTTAPNFGYINDSLANSVTFFLQRLQHYVTTKASPTTSDITLSPIQTAVTAPIITPTQATISSQSKPPLIALPELNDRDNPLIERLSTTDELDKSAATELLVNIEIARLADTTPTLYYRSGIKGYASPSALVFAVNQLAQLEPSTPSTAVFDEITPANGLSKQQAEVVINAPTTIEQPNKQPVKPTPKRDDTDSIALAKARRQALEEEKAKQRQADIAAALANPRLHEGLLHQQHSLINDNNTINDSFDELADDLSEVQLAVEQAADDNLVQLYQQTVTTLQPLMQRAQINNNEQAVQHIAYQQAYELIEHVAQIPSADALLRQALFLFRGNALLAIEKNPSAAIQAVKTAATLADARAEKLLSKLYFSGEFIEADSAQGNYWLRQAAAHGHPAAQAILDDIAIATTLQQSQRSDRRYLRQLSLGIALLMVLALIIIVFINI